MIFFLSSWIWLYLFLNVTNCQQQEKTLEEIFEYLEPGDQYATRSMYEALQEVQRAVKRTKCEWDSPDKWKDPMTMFNYFKQPPTPLAAQIAHSSDVFQRALSIIQSHVNKPTGRFKRRVNVTDVLSPKTLQALMAFSGCKANKNPPSCDREDCFKIKYRSITGECNNLNHPEWGMASMPLARWLDPIYEDDFSQPLGWDNSRMYNGFRLPMVRKVSNDIMHTDNSQVSDDLAYSHLLVVWGQYIDHDIDFTPQSLSTSTFQGLTNCKETCKNEPPCFPMMVPEDDSRIDNAQTKCLPFFRSASVCGSGETSSLFGSSRHREQINGITAFIDASTVYGSDDDLAFKLRDHSEERKGKMLVNDRFKDNGRDYLPFKPGDACVQHPNHTEGDEKIPCFLAGDGRVSEHITLSAIHTLWVREHNLVFDRLKQINPHWDAEIVFHETRKIIGSMHQVVNYNEYLPKILGNWRTEVSGPTQYNAHERPDVSNVFATAAFRFGHTTIMPMFRRLDENNNEHPQFPNIPLHKAFFSPWRLILEGGLDPVMRGLIERPAKLLRSDEILNEELREKLFAMQNQVALDLASLNLQRGRDHGLPLYNAWRKFCNLSEVMSFDELRNEITNETIRDRLREVYGHPGNMDVWLGGLVEDFVPGTRVGPTFLCMLSKQFRSLMYGDRMFYSHSGVHTPAQVAELNKFTFAHVICHNTGVSSVRQDTFSMTGPRVQCSDLNTDEAFDLNKWREDPNAGSCGAPPMISNGYWTRCPHSDNVVAYKCKDGYELFGAKKITCNEGSGQYSSQAPSCVDVNECEMERFADRCMDECINTIGSFRCGCREGRQLMEDGMACKDIEEDEGGSAKPPVATEEADSDGVLTNDNTAAIVVGVVLGVAVVGLVIFGAIGIYKYTKLMTLMRYNTKSKFQIGNDGVVGTIPNPNTEKM